MPAITGTLTGTSNTSSWTPSTRSSPSRSRIPERHCDDFGVGPALFWLARIYPPPLTLGGDAVHRYRPTTTGTQQFVATYTPAGAKPVTARTTVNVTVARSAYHPAPAKPLASVGKGMVVFLFTVVAAIWLTLGTQIWRVRRVIRRPQEPTTSPA